MVAWESASLRLGTLDRSAMGLQPAMLARGPREAAPENPGSAFGPCPHRAGGAPAGGMPHTAPPWRLGRSQSSRGEDDSARASRHTSSLCCRHHVWPACHLCPLEATRGTGGELRTGKRHGEAAAGAGPAASPRLRLVPTPPLCSLDVGRSPVPALGKGALLLSGLEWGSGQAPGPDRQVVRATRTPTAAAGPGLACSSRSCKAQPQDFT